MSNGKDCLDDQEEPYEIATFLTPGRGFGCCLRLGGLTVNIAYRHKLIC